MSNPLADMELPDLFFCIGTNMTECHPVAATRLKRAVDRGATLIVADPRRIGLADRAELFLPIRVGSDTALLLAMAHVIVREGLIDPDFVAARTEGYEAFAEAIRDKTADWAAEICEVPAADIERAGLLFGRSPRAAIYYTLGITEHISGVDNVQSLSNLALMTGNIGRPGTGINPMRGQNNIQGAGDCGAIPAAFPGFQWIDQEGSVEKFEKLYGRSMDRERGITKVTAFERAGNGIHALLIDGENTLVSDPDREHGQRALEAMDHLVVIDLFLTETAELADVVLPASAWAETDGTVTNTERRVQRLRAAVPAQGESKPDWQILSWLAQRMGCKGFEYASAQEVFDELCSVSPIYAGLDWESTGDGAYQWPCPEKGHPGTPRLHEESFVNGRGKFKLISYRDPAETVSEDFPVWLTTGRRLASYHTRTQTGRSSGIDYLAPQEFLEVHPSDIERFGLIDGQPCRLSSARGSIEIVAKSDDRLRPGTVFTSFSFAEVAVNALTGSGYDPVTQTAELKVCPVRLESI